FTKEPTTLYNPFGMLLHLKSRGEYFPYWYQSGTPSFLAELIKKQRINVANLGKLEIDCADLRECDAARLDAIGILYQSGYLTITGYEERRDRFILDYPNIEVKSAFAKTLIGLHLGVQTEPARSLFADLPHYLVAGKIRAALRAISECLASIDYEITQPLEFYYETAIVLIFRIFGLDCRPEVRLAAGRIDALVETSAYAYCFEFKLDNDAEAALAQINRKGYLTPWRGSGKKLFKVGVGIDRGIRSIGNVEIRVVRARGGEG
ncbi:MAG: PD-(D/E)XK nuclease domain-containing protein, partial [Polyangiaceae bacterium]|nr:PD-(D/E)XK nuclease domain-containing protein [Polyangiaceae bacterium]